MISLLKFKRFEEGEIMAQIKEFFVSLVFKAKTTGKNVDQINI